MSLYISKAELKVLYTCTYKDSIIKATKYCLKRREQEWKYNGRGELVQGTLHMCMELSQ
jgi:hypothetical protein